MLSCPADTIRYLEEFTETYRQWENADIYAREAACLETQYRHVMLPLRKGDLIAGRKVCPLIGFAPQANQTVGYYCDAEGLRRFAEESELTEEQKDSLRRVEEFWSSRTTEAKIKARYTPDQLLYLTHGDYTAEPGIGCPLYRMSGAQMNPRKLLSLGLDAMIEEADAHDGNRAFYAGVKRALLLLQKILLDYGEEAFAGAQAEPDGKRRVELCGMAENLRHIARRPPDTFWQAMQLSYLFFLVSGAINYGRMDDYLGSCFANDIDNGIITEEFGLALIKNLWSLMIEQKRTWDTRVILGGKNRGNPEDADRFAMLAMEASRQTHDALPQLTLRLYDGMNPALYEKALTMLGEGGTYPLLYNDEVNIPAAAEAFRVDETAAADYVPFGCGEYVLYGKSFGTPSGTINFLYCLNTLIHEGEANLLENCGDFELFYRAFLEKAARYILLLAQQEKLEYDVCGKDAAYLFFSILFDDCMERGLGMFEGGVRYLGGTLETYGNTNTADSLTAIKTLVYDKKVITPQQLAQALRQDFAGYEALRRLLLEAPKFGNDDPEADAMAVRFHDDICRIVRDCAGQAGLHSYLAVIINNSMNTTFGNTTGASADGRRAHTFLANANNPTGGMDRSGITAMLNSLVKLKTKHHAGSVQNMRFSKEMFGERLIEKTKGLLAVYFANGGSQAMVSVLGREDLKNAMLEPEKYQNLLVRVGGFSAKFVELSHDVQLELLSRTLYG